MIIRLNEYINTRFLRPNSAGINNIPSLDGVRGMAILMVITCHLFSHSVDTGGGFPLTLNIAGNCIDIKNLLLSGANGVRLFFILSAFLLFIPYARTTLQSPGTIDIKRFYWRRAMRILPAYLLILFVLSLAIWLGKRGAFNPLNFFLNILFINPFFFFRHDVGPDFIPSTWSLVTEVHFYLILPFIAEFFYSLKRGVLTALSLIALSFFYRAYVVAHFTAYPASFILSHNILAHIDQFGLGMLAAFIYVKQNERGWKIYPWVPYMLIISGVFTYWWIYNGGLFFIKDYETLLGLSFFMIVLGVVSGSSPVRRLMEWGPLRIFGLISYSMFLINAVLAMYILGPLMDMFLIREPLQRLAFNMTVGVLILFLVSMLSYLYVERPFLVKKQNRQGAS
ncbi:MAG: acyltransferase [Sedimentisphaerales bacterium]